MYGRRLNTLPYNEELTEGTLDSSYAEKSNELEKALVRHQTLSKQFEKRFINSFPALREYPQATKKGQTTVIKEKDVVLVHDEKPRKERKYSCHKHPAKGITNRPISKLHPIKVSIDGPTRKCAVQAKEVVRKIYEQQEEASLLAAG
ncbi:hypothetical protein GHT06_010839 [Daphnia sinensis]|uniref:Uncharacterized protein n=1 Tax=Daphnia sinensis TaxID=1820382 RepID=A0AAD5KZ30_9CRUS|nr:hypothetical protein GHT06_010839 [Daphnia sinensis]